jgi:O-antigen biosynthesis protein
MTTAAPPHDQSPGPLVICGMHRSGTSLTASLFGGAGVNLGDRLFGPNVGNTLGHFEDVGFLEFHMRALHSLGSNYEGFVTRPLAPLAAEFTAEAEQIVADRSAAGRLWGWKEPRTTLFLDFWDQLLPDARYVFVFRNPWDVADSLFRRGDAAFVVDPRLAIDLWVAYNRRIAEFIHRHPSRCVVFEISQLIAEPDRVFEMVRSRLQFPIGTPPDSFRNDLFGRECNQHGSAIVRAITPEAHDLYHRLRQLAGEPPAATDEAGVDAPSLAAYAVEEWARASRAAVRERKLHAEVTAISAREQDLATALTAVTSDRDEVFQHLVTVTTERDRLAKEIEVVAASRLRLESECRRLCVVNEQLAAELAEARDSGMVRRLVRWASESFVARRPAPPRQAETLAFPEDVGRRRAA